MDTKESELETAQQALLELKEENGAAGMNLSDAQTEKKELEDQVAADTKFIAEVQESFDIKLGEFKERKRLRTEEVASISNAIGILRSDVASMFYSKNQWPHRDTFLLKQTSKEVQKYKKQFL
jgi:FtsZ-binding cell division protein ZapB